MELDFPQMRCDVLETGLGCSRGERDDGEGIFRVGERLKEADEGSRVFNGPHHEPDEAGDAIGELKGGFPFSQSVGGDDLAFFHCDLAEAGDEEFAPDDHDGDPGWAKSHTAEEDEGGGNENLVSQRIHELAERSDEIEFSCKVAIEPIGDGSHNKGHQGDKVS